ncbi:MAG TPA: NCS2 family permease [Desulfobacteraceae bacterium]|nr:NCS2 family permease [Desulfobacteraceae bacterium]HPJ69121.1 NCS2 family permease [Desulfobacteraceae bacterium]HPQ29102.1 NCS2 family permease [Desulfobacteraceae bacterium]
MEKLLDKIFDLKKNGTNLKTEVLAGVTTFLSMAYIIVVNPGVLKNAGMPFSGVLFATVLVCSLSSLAMGLYAKLPYSLAPGMGINAFFTFSLVVEKGIRWETALGAVFISGLIFMILSATGIREEIVKAIPSSIRNGMAAGIGVFLSFIGFINVGFIIPEKATLVSFGGLHLKTILFLAGFIITSVLAIKRIRGAMVIGIMVTSILTLAVSSIVATAGWLSVPLITLPKEIFALPSFEVFLKLDIIRALSIGMILPILSLLLVDLFDSVGTFVGVSQKANLVDRNGIPLRIGRALMVDAFSTTISGLFGTSSGSVYVESATGIQEGGRTGLTAVISGLLFLPFMFLSPMLSFIPAVATAPVLVLVGILMMSPLADIEWNNFEEAIPGFLSFALIPLTFSITQGVIWGLLIYTAIKLATGKAHEINTIVYFIDIFAIIILSTGL